MGLCSFVSNSGLGAGLGALGFVVDVMDGSRGPVSVESRTHRKCARPQDLEASTVESTETVRTFQEALSILSVRTLGRPWLSPDSGSWNLISE